MRLDVPRWVFVLTESVHVSNSHTQVLIDTDYT